MNIPNSNAPAENIENAGDAALDSLLDNAPETAPAPAAPQVAPAQTAPIVGTPALDSPPVIARLNAATAGLLMASETDAPFRTVYWPLEKTEITPAEIALYLTENAEATVEMQSVQAFFKNAVAVESWMSDDEKATAKRFETLVETLESELDKPQVYRIGEREITAAVIGKIAGGFAGVVTTVVET